MIQLYFYLALTAHDIELYWFLNIGIPDSPINRTVATSKQTL